MHKRERLLVGAVAILLGGWLADSVVVQPTIAWFAAVEKQTVAAQAEADEAKVLIDRQPRIMAEWRARHAAGLLDDEGQARFRLQKTLQSAAQSSGFAIASVSGGQLVPAGQELHYDLLRLTISGNGTLSQAQAFVAALETAAMPLAIERSEWSAGDARKDHLEVALTLSTRLVSTAARAGRAVPNDTVPWTPAARDATMDAAIAATKPFLADRRGSPSKNQPEAKTTTTATVAATVSAERKGWAVVGIVVHDENNAVAFLRHQSDGSERSVRQAEVVDSFTVVAIDANGLRLSDANGETTIAVGQDLHGRTISGVFAAAPALSTAVAASTATAPNTTSTTPAATVTPAAGAAPFQIPTAAADPARDAILQRLREKRNRTP